MNEHHERLMLVVGMYTNQARAQQLVEKLIQEDFPMDRISLLSRVGGAGDDMLGVTYHDTGERMKAWGKHGAFWGAVWGLLASASGMFVLPGLGPLLVAGIGGDLLCQRRGDLVFIIMGRVYIEFRRQLKQFVEETVVELVGISAGEVCPSRAADQQGITGQYTILQYHTDGVAGVPGRVHDPQA